MEPSACANIISALAKVMSKAGSVKKGGKNTFHNYAYATASDVFFELQPLMAENGIVVFQDEAEREFMADGKAIAVTYEFTIAHSSGEVWPVKPRHTGVAAAFNSKGGFDDKSVNKCHTAARKYFMLALFQIPTGDYPDPDADGDVPHDRGQAGQPREQGQHHSPPKPGDKGTAAALLHAINLCENETDLNAWYQNNDTKTAMASLTNQDFEDVRSAWAARRAVVRKKEAA